MATTAEEMEFAVDQIEKAASYLEEVLEGIKGGARTGYPRGPEWVGIEKMKLQIVATRVLLDEAQRLLNLHIP